MSEDHPIYDLVVPRRHPPARRSAMWMAAVARCALASLVFAACGSSPHPNSTRAPLPAGPLPSEIAKMVCQPKTQKELADALGLKATVGAQTWVDHRYSCPYLYPNGRFVLTVQELSSWGQTLSYFHSLGRQLGDARSLGNLGQGAFQTADGSVVVRKDWKVLLVNIAGLPDQFGVPPTNSADVAVTVADVILGCWSGD